MIKAWLCLGASCGRWWCFVSRSWGFQQVAKNHDMHHTLSIWLCTQASSTESGCQVACRPRTPARPHPPALSGPAPLVIARWPQFLGRGRVCRHGRRCVTSPEPRQGQVNNWGFLSSRVFQRGVYSIQTIVCFQRYFLQSKWLPKHSLLHKIQHK